MCSICPLVAGAHEEMAKGKQILIVDDDQEIRELLKEYLTRSGFDVLAAAEGGEMYQHLASNDPDLIILDMMMPKRSGFLVLETLRQANSYPVRIIMVTANEGARHRAYAEQLGVDEYLKKPFPMELLLETVARVLAK